LLKNADTFEGLTGNSQSGERCDKIDVRPD